MVSAESILDPAVNHDPYPYLESLHQAPGLVWDQRWRGWIVSRHADLMELLSRPELSAERLPNVGASSTAASERARDIMARWVVFMDPPRHTEVRPKIVPAFSPKLVRQMHDVVEATFDELMCELRGEDEFDFIKSVAFPYPARIIGRLFGVPDADLDQFGIWSDDVASLMHAGREDVDRVVGSLLELDEYLTTQLRNGLRSSMIDSLATLDAADLVSTCVLLLFAGHETTKNLLGNSMAVLSDWEAEAARLREGQVDVSSAVDEILRFEGPAKASVRVVGESFEFAGSELEAGQKVLLSFAGANRDGSVFERPNDLILDRPNARNMAFGHGIHYCVGAPLARLETQVALAKLGDYWEGFEPVTGPAEREWQDRLLNRGLDRLPMKVVWR